MATRTRTKPSWQKLSWHDARKQWKKYKGGKTYYLGQSGVRRYDRLAHDEALAEWKQVLEQFQAPQKLRDEKVNRIMFMWDYPDTKRAELEAMSDEEIDAQIDFLSNLSSSRKRYPALGESEYGYIQVVPESGNRSGIVDVDVYQTNSQVPQRSEKPRISVTISDHIDGFIKSVLLKAKLGNLSLNRVDNLRRYLGYLSDWVMPDGELAGNLYPTDISSVFIRDFYHYLCELVSEKRLATSTAKSIFSAFRFFVKRLWQDEIIDLPRNLNDRGFSFYDQPTPIKIFTVEEIHRVWDVATTKARLYILLGLNCGFTARDLTDLKQEEVDWQNGTITRRRSKLRRNSTTRIQKICYSLWPSTFKLLKEFRSTNSETVLLTQNNGPLVEQHMGDNGILKRSDTVKCAFQRAADKAGVAPAFTMFRATGATLIGNQFDEGLADQWMCHAPQTVAQRHYIAPSQERLDSAIEWLGKEVGLYELN